jgi:DNA-binding CsgD family transcriptional regulator
VADPGPGRDVLLQVGAVASSAGPDPRDACAEVLDLVHDIVPYAASSISAYDPVTGEHHTLSSSGYSEHALRHLDTWFVDHDEAYHYMRRVDIRPLRWRDFPFEYRGMFSAQQVFLPEGFQDGMTICLCTRDGRYTGNLHISTDDVRVLSDAALPVLAELQRLLGGVADQMRAVGYMVASMDGPGADAAVVLSDGTVVPVPGRPTGDHLRSGSALARMIADRLTDHVLPGQFRWRDEDGQWHAVRTRRVSTGVAVTDRRDPLPHGLTPSEMRVLAGLVEGWSNAEIATSLVVSPRTVSKHVEHILEKLGCATRTSAAVHATKTGLVHLQDG